MKKDVIGASHEFHDKKFAQSWAERFEPTKERINLFGMILSELMELIPDGGRIIELGIGPGFLAKHLLESMPDIEYHGIDFSQPMLEIAGKRLEGFSSRISYTQADLVNDPWEELFEFPFNAIVSTWALHDLGSKENVETVYSKSLSVLGINGILLNGDFIKPEGTIQEFEGGRFEIVEHLSLLKKSGYLGAKCLATFEIEVESPTPAQNYACIKAVK